MVMANHLANLVIDCRNLREFQIEDKAIAPSAAQDDMMIVVVAVNETGSARQIWRYKTAEF
jgi:hypothetical protein